MASTSNPTIDKIKQRLEQGYTLDELKAIAEDKGLMDEEVSAFFDSQMSPAPEKKNSILDESDSDSPNMDLSVESGSSESAPSTATETSLGDTEEEAFQQKITDARAGAVGGALGKLAQDTEADLAEWREIRKGKEPQAPKDFTGKEITRQTLMAMDENDPMRRAYEDQIREYERKTQIYNSTEEDIRQTRLVMEKDNVNKASKQLDLAQEGEKSAFTGNSRVDGHQEDNFIKYDEDGKLVVNEEKTAATFAAIDEGMARREAIIEKETEKLEGYNFIQETGYDFYTGMRNFGNGFVAAFDEDQGAVNEYYNSLRTAASFKEAGLTEEDVAEGIVGNLSKGNLFAAGTILATQTVQQMPQLLGQVGIAYATGGLGMAASMTASSAAMGISAYGSTIASYKGLISDDQMYTMAVGDALVEFISERAFTGDIADMLGKSALKGASIDEVRRTMFKKGFFSKEMGELVATTGAKMADSGTQEFFEELLAGIGGGLVHSAINGEEFSMMEAFDGAILGFSSGSMSGTVRGSRRLLTGGMSALGYGGFRTEMLKINNAKQKLANELRKTTDANSRAVIQQKIDGLDALAVQVQAEQSEAYDQYSDSDAEATVKLNQSVKDKLLKLKKSELTEEESNRLKEEIKNDYAEIQKIEGKYEGVRAEIKQQKETNQEWLNSQETSVEVDANTKLPDTPLMKGIQMVAKALGGKSKVYIHRNLDDAAEITGKSKMELAGANGFFIADDGSVHVMAAQAQQNTAYHEGFHRILREVDAGYAKRFVDAAFKGMDAETKAKYQKIYNAGMKQGGQALAVEETFAELAADITAGNINAEGSGTSVVRAAMGSLAKSLGVLGIPVKAQPSFNEFANYVQAVSNDFKSGDAVTEGRGRFGSNQVQEGKFNQRMIDGAAYLSEADFNRLNPLQLKDYLEGNNLVHKSISDLIQANYGYENLTEAQIEEKYNEIYTDRKSFEDNMKTNGYLATEVITKVVDSLKGMRKNKVRSMRIDVLEQMMEQKLFEGTYIILDDQSKMHEFHGMEQNGGFFHNNRDDSMAINMYLGELSADWMAQIILHEHMHRLTALELDKADSKFASAIEAIMDVADDAFAVGRDSQDSNVNIKEKMETEGVESLTQFEAAVMIQQQYGFTNVHEMVAEAFSNPAFQQLLTKIPVDMYTEAKLKELGFNIKSGSNFFDAFKDLVKNMLSQLGISIPNNERTMFDAVVIATAQEMENQKMEGNNGVFFQMSEENLNEFEQSVEKAQEPAWTIAKGKEYGQSKITGETKQTNLAEVIENFKKENGRAPRVLVWGGDQSGRGTYTTKNGTEINIEGGISFAEDQENKDNGVAWASNKGANDINSMMANADIVAIAAMSPETGHAFYKGSSTVYFTEIAEAMNNNAGQSIVWKDAPKNGKGEAITIEIPQEGFADPILAMRSLYEQLEEKVGKNKDRQVFLSETEGFSSLSEYLAQSEDGKRQNGLRHLMKGGVALDKFLGNLGAPSITEIQDGMRDKYLVENDFQDGDIYMFFKPTRGKDGKVQTAEGKHGTYGTDIKGEILGVANRKDNIYEIAPVSQFTTSEGAGTTTTRLELGVQQGYLAQSKLDEINATEDTKEQNQLKNLAIREMYNAAKEAGDTDFLERQGLTGGVKSGYVTADMETSRAGKKVSKASLKTQSRKSVQADAGTTYDGQEILESLIAGRTAEQKIQALIDATNELVQEGEATRKTSKFIVNQKGVEITRDVIPVGKLLERVASKVGENFETMKKSQMPEGQRKTAVFFQSVLVGEVSDRILYGEKKADIIASLRAKGMSRADANLVYAKASQYAKGARKGWNEGRKEMSKQYAEQRREERKKESEKSKDLRKKAQAILKQEKKTGDVIIREIINLIKESGVNIKASQVQTLIRLTRKVSRLKGKNALNPEARYSVLNSVIDKVVAIIEKQETAEGLATYINTLRNVESEQKKLKDRLKKLKAGSRSPLISYAEQVLDLTSINPSLLSRESLELLQQALKDLNTTTKSVSVRKGTLSNPYVEIEGIGKVDTRRAKIYFDTIFEQLKVEEVSQNERVTAQEAADRAFENGTDWVTEYDNILRERAQKELKGVQKKLTAIANEMDLDLNDVNDLEAALELLAEEKKEKINSDKEVIISEAILPTFANFRRMYEAHPEFAAIFGGTAMLEDEQALDLVKARMQQLSGLELKRLEFAMYDFAVNGKALGISSLRAVVEVKNDANPALKGLNLKSVENQGQITKGLFSRFENTPTFLRRIFKASETKIAQFMAITGFADLRHQVALADMVANEFDTIVQNKAKELGFNTLAQQTRLQIYSLLSQKPEGMSEAQYLAQVFANLELALESDRRFTESQRAEIREALDEMYEDNKKKNYKELMEMYEGMENLTEMINFVRAEFEFQQPSMKAYAEEFLGMNFKEENNYLPIRYRKVGTQNEQIAALQDDISNVNAAYRSHNMTKAQSQASSTFERNENAMGSKSRYVDLNFFNTVSKAYRENEVKHRTAPALAKVSAATSESNKTFRDVVTQPEQRMALRKKIVQFLLNDGAFNQSEELFPKWMKNSISTLNDLTVLYYFGSVVTQTLKQMSAVFNTITEGSVMDTFGYAMLSATGRLTGDMKRVLNRADIGGRDYIEQVVNLQSAKSTMQGKGLRERMMDLSTKALRSTDKVAATASWLVYFEQYMVNEKGAEKGSWAEWSENFDAEAAAYASTMVAKDQNISTARDKSDFNRIDKKSIGSVIQMMIMPFANFLLNKKMNLMLDVRNLSSKDTRMNAVKSISGTALEVTAFHAVSQFVIAPMITALASAFTGAGEEEEEASWYDFEFRKKMFVKGLATDMNPYILPIGAIESQYTTILNMIDYIALEDDAMKHDFADRTWYENFQAWERANGLPKFGNMVGRGDANWVTHLRSAGVYGDMTVELGTAISNIATLQEKNPYYISSYGSVKYVTPKDAKRLLQLESAKAGFMIQGAFTGLFSKEVVQTIKSRERQISKRATGNENENIARILIDDRQKGTELIKDKIDNMVKDNPLAIEGQVQSMVGEKVIKSVEADKQPSKKYVNTIRQINAATQDPRDAAMMAKRVMADLSPEEARAFERDLIKYYALKEGENAVVKLVMILNR